MKCTLLLMAAIISISACQTKNSESNTNDQSAVNVESIDKQEITSLLLTYRDALNASDVDKVLQLYTEGGIFMPSGAPSSIGIEQVKGAYEFVFSNIKLSIEFYID